MFDVKRRGRQDPSASNLDMFDVKHRHNPKISIYYKKIQAITVGLCRSCRRLVDQKGRAPCRFSALARTISHRRRVSDVTLTGLACNELKCGASHAATPRPAALRNLLERHAMLVDRSPQPVDLALDHDPHLVEVPDVSRAWCPPTSTAGDSGARTRRLPADGLVRYDNLALERQLLVQAQGEREADRATQRGRSGPPGSGGACRTTKP